jgi:hypothetical protein
MSETSSEPERVEVEVAPPTLEDRVAELETRLAAVEEPAADDGPADEPNADE